ncbi:MAG: hypothetical protein WBB74_12555 [Gaiellaceae bacterium]
MTPGSGSSADPAVGSAKAMAAKASQIPRIRFTGWVFTEISIPQTEPGFPVVLGRERLGLEVEIQISDPDLLDDLCDYLSRAGFVVIERAEKVADVLLADAPREAAQLALATSIGLWRAARPDVVVAIDA